MCVSLLSLNILAYIDCILFAYSHRLSPQRVLTLECHPVRLGLLDAFEAAHPVSVERRSVGCSVLAAAIFLILAAVCGLFLILHAGRGSLARAKVCELRVEHVSEDLRVDLLEFVEHFVAVLCLTE